MDSVTRKRLDYLLTRSLEGAVTAEQIDELNRLIGCRTWTLAYCIEFLETAACLYKVKGYFGAADRHEESLAVPEMLGEVIEQDEQIHARNAAQLAEVRRDEIRKAAETAFERFKEQERRRQEELAHRRYLARRRQLAVGIFAAVALVLVTVSVWVASRPAKPVVRPVVKVAGPLAPLPVVATVTRASRVHGGRTDVALAVGTDLTAGPITLDKGFVEITFRSHARLIIEAPAVMSLVDERRIRLDQGVLTVHVPEEARGFEVETPSARVTDLGTEFALAVDASGAADVHVLDGWVAASFTAAGHDEQQRVKALYQDHAMRFDAGTGTMNSIAVDGERFARSWDDVLYKPRVEGAVRFEWSTPASLCENALEHDKFIRVFMERTDVLLGGSTIVNIAGPGQYKSFAGLSASLPAGARVDSYLLHWDPKSVSGTRRIISGRVTFRRPILGVIATAEQLSTADEMFGLPDTEYPAHSISRRLESASDRQNADTVMLSPDRLTLEVKLRAGSIDQVRILVAAPSVEER